MKDNRFGSLKVLIFFLVLISIVAIFNIYFAVSESLSISSIILALLALFIGIIVGFFYIALAIGLDKLLKPLEIKIKKRFQKTKKLNASNGALIGVVVGIILSTFWIRPWVDEYNGAFSNFLPVVAVGVLMGFIIYPIYSHLHNKTQRKQKIK